MKYSSGPQVPTMPKDGPDSVRGRVGDAREFSPQRAIVGQSETCLLGSCQRRASPNPINPVEVRVPGDDINCA